MTIATGNPVTIADLTTTLWAGLAAHAAKTSSQKSESVLQCDFKSCSGVDDAIPRPRRAYVEWVPSTDVKIIGIIVETASTTLAFPPNQVYLSLSTSAQGEIWDDLAVVTNSTTTRTAFTTPFTTNQVVIGGGDLVTVAFENADFGAAELTKCFVYIVYTALWSNI